MAIATFSPRESREEKESHVEDEIDSPTRPNSRTKTPLLNSLMKITKPVQTNNHPRENSTRGLARTKENPGSNIWFQRRQRSNNVFKCFPKPTLPHNPGQPPPTTPLDPIIPTSSLPQPPRRRNNSFDDVRHTPLKCNRLESPLSERTVEQHSCEPQEA